MGKLTATAIVERALEIGDAEGLDAVTIRRLATDLGVTPMALYWHFKNKDLLLVGMADHLLAGFTLEPIAGDSWQRGLRALVEDLIRVLRRHAVALAVLETVGHTEAYSFLKIWDRALGLARAAGFTADESCLISNFLLKGAVSIAGASSRVMLLATATEMHRLKVLRLQSLPVREFPNLVAMAVPMIEGSSDELYDTFGVDLLLSGIETLAARRAVSP